MAETPQLSLGWRNVFIGVGCVLGANILVALLGMAVPLPGPEWIWSAIAASVGILVWFALAGRMRK